MLINKDEKRAADQTDYILVTAARRNHTRQVMVGDVAVGGGAPVSVQSMCTTKTADADATLAQIQQLADVGCEIIRVAIPSKKDVEGFGRVCALSPLPVVADIHFDYRLALAAIEKGCSALRINPGNIGSWDKVDAVIDAAGAAGIPIRIGVNAGSLDPSIDADQSLTLPEKLIRSCELFVEHFEARQFKDIVLSAKVHSVKQTIETYRMLSKRLPDYPLHVGVTEAGTLMQGTVKNALAVGSLLLEGIGDTMRLSLTADPVYEVNAAWDVLSACGLRRLHPELVSCPTCGRCHVDLIPVAEEVSARLAQIDVPISVAVMGCAVNGPGEARDADIGLACGMGKALLFVEGKPLRSVPESSMIDELMCEITQRFVGQQ